MKIALCNSGHIRTMQQVLNNQNDFLIEFNNCDVFVYTSDLCTQRECSQFYVEPSSEVFYNKKYPKGPKLFTQPTLKQIQNLHGEGVTLVAARNRLYYGVNDPAYQTAIKAARKNNKDGQKSFKRVSVINDF